MRSFLVSIIIALFLASFASGEAVKKSPFGRHEGDGLQVLKEKIGLTDDQLNKLEGLKLESMKSVQTARHEIEMEKISLEEAGLKGTLTKERLKESVAKMKEKAQAIHNVRFQAAQSAIDLLTPEQIKKMSDKRLLGMIVHFARDKDHDRPEKTR